MLRSLNYMEFRENLEDFDVPSVSVKMTFEAQWKKTREFMIGDIVRSIQLNREKMKNDSSIEPFSFSDLVKSAKQTIWIDESELILLCHEALFRLLDPRDYRYGHDELFLEDIA